MVEKNKAQNQTLCLKKKKTNYNAVKFILNRVKSCIQFWSIQNSAENDNRIYLCRCKLVVGSERKDNTITLLLIWIYIYIYKIHFNA